MRDLFAQAKAAAPAIIFIDELDAIGRSRAAAVSFGGGADEREQTLNQILTEMDGFDSSTGVIVLGATNRPDILDPALLRAGRFDRRVAVQPPDQAGRLAILKVHTRGIPLAADADLEALAGATPGMVGADLASFANEAALLAATRGHDAVQMRDFDDALAKTLLGTERRLIMTEHDRERTAHHEAGHALVGMLSRARRPGPAHLDHPARHRARRHLRRPGRRPLQLHARGAAHQDPRGAGRPRRRAARVRRRDDRRRVGHRAAHRDRPPDGGPLGHERRGRRPSR